MFQSSAENAVPAAITATKDSFFFKPFIQPKLKVNQPGDQYEQEADAVADKLMRMEAADNVSEPFFKPVASSLQRKCAACEAEDTTLQRKETNDGADASSTENYLNTLSGGNALSDNQRSFYEPKMGHDFSGVRLHTGSLADKSASDINALAYTHGNDIVFKAGEYKPETDDGKRLLAHELTHVVQQSSSGNIMRTPNPRPASPTALTDYSEANRQRITYDPDFVRLDPRLHFQQGIVETPRTGFDVDYVFTGTIATWLQPPLRSMARAIFALQETDTDPVMVNTLLIKALDLTPFHENNNAANPAGPNTRFRFTCKEFDASSSTVAGSRQTVRNVQIIIEDIGLPQTIPHAAENATQRIARFAADYNFTRVDDTFFNDADFNRVLIAVSLIPDNVLRSVSGIPFNRIAGQAVGPTGEAAEYTWNSSGGVFTRVINIYDSALSSSTTAQSLAFLMTHEIGHAVAHRPAEAAGTAAHTDLAAETGRGSFREAATADGGLTRAITTYGATGWGEYFAEAFSMFINEPGTLTVLRPHVFTYFTTRFPAPAAPVAPPQAGAPVPAPNP